MMPPKMSAAAAERRGRVAGEHERDRASANQGELRPMGPANEKSVCPLLSPPKPVAPAGLYATV
jgi:hypothetical protein